MKSCVFIAFAFAAVAFASEKVDPFEESLALEELIQDIPDVEEDLMSAVHELRGAAPQLLQEHVKVVTHHAVLIQESKAKAYAHSFSESQDQIKKVLKDLNNELKRGMNHDIEALKTAKASGNKIVTDADTAAKSRVREYRDHACPTKRAEESAQAQMDAAKKKMDGIADAPICDNLSTTWGDMDIDGTRHLGTTLRTKWQTVREQFTKAKTEWNSATKAHDDAAAAHLRSMAGFTAALGMMAENVVDTCNAAHQQYATLVSDVQSNVNSRKQTFIAGLVIECYIDNITSNTGAKKCADGARGADLKEWNIDGGSLDSCASKESNQQRYGPKGWQATTANCQGHEARLKTSQEFIKVQSAGYTKGNYGKIDVDGKSINGRGRRGFNLVTVDAMKGTVLATKDYDTHGKSNAGANMLKFIQGLPTGTVVVAAVMDEAAHRGAKALEALKLCGAVSNLSIKYRGSYAFIGRKGAKSGTAYETKNNAGSPVSLTHGLKAIVEKMK